MSHPEDDFIPFDFINDWVKIGLPGKVDVLKEYEGYDFQEQYKFYEKVLSNTGVTMNNSLVNLRTYPYVQREIRNNIGLLGGYYDFVKGEFKLWKYESPITEPITIALSTHH
ncbi:hypothetical protein PHAVU_010G069300 [Phaseolus vulgaris]|uniref:Uncharacterized protein n=1 Tax=Phaseolus vulgaris TaxID=3885 RepID=V7AM79_PHAVU|nr:hypothetical protein PHAVU_010G069300g [Phaseolus vulgaris]ESW06697.1 hypothetical protein PHAVU_010G069300g [Phaseolus vulgaris]